MTRSNQHLSVLACGLLLFAAAPSFATDASIMPPPGIRGEVVANMMDAGDKIIELAGAVPAGKWAWRPGKGVRSVGEVYLHAVQGNYFLCSFLGTPPPMKMEELQKLDTTPQTPEKTVQMLKDSYAFAARTIEGLSDTDLAVKVNFFGNMMTKQAIMLAAAAHSHEHLGQSIAYARMNRVVPPWTAREQAAAAKKAAEQPGHSH